MVLWFYMTVTLCIKNIMQTTLLVFSSLSLVNVPFTIACSYILWILRNHARNRCIFITACIIFPCILYIIVLCLNSSLQKICRKSRVLQNSILPVIYLHVILYNISTWKELCMQGIIVLSQMDVNVRLHVETELEGREMRKIQRSEHIRVP